MEGFLEAVPKIISVKLTLLYCIFIGNCEMQLQLKIDNGQLTIKVKMLRILLKSKGISL